jgi:23S rRNA (cytosine1962-C5)-methyltransferase
VPARVECADEQPVSRRPPENAWRSTHPWIFQKLVEKPAQKPKPGAVVDVVGVDGEWIGRGFYNGHSRIALRMVENEPDALIDADWFMRRIGAAVDLRRNVLGLDAVSDAWRVVHSEGDDLSGLVVDRYGDLLVVEFFSAGMFRHREWIYDALRAHFPAAVPRFAEEHVQKQESFDFHGNTTTEPAIITEHGIKFRADPAGAHKTGFFADQRENREWLSSRCGQARARPVLQHRRLRRVRGARRGRGAGRGHRRGRDPDRQGQRPAQRTSQAGEVRAGRHLPVAARRRRAASSTTW